MLRSRVTNPGGVQKTVPYLGSGRPVRAVAIRVVKGPDKGQQLTSEGAKVSVGTAQGNTLVLTDPTVSRYHLDLRAHEGGIEVVDLGSTNGTLAEKLRLQRAVVPPKTRLKLGKTEVQVEAAGEVMQPLHAEDRLGALIGRSDVVRRVMAQITQAGASDAPVLVVGEIDRSHLIDLLQRNGMK